MEDVEKLISHSNRVTTVVTVTSLPLSHVDTTDHNNYRRWAKVNRFTVHLYLKLAYYSVLIS